MFNSYEEWFAELCLVAIEFGYQNTNNFDKEVWEIYFEEGLSPREALLEDSTYT